MYSHDKTAIPVAIHDAKNDKIALFIALFSLIFEIIITMLFFNERLSGIGFLGAHFGLVLILAYPIIKTQCRHTTLSFILLAFLGAFGAFVATITHILYLFFKDETFDVDKWFKELDPEVELSESALLYEKIIYGQELMPDQIDTEPFTDVMRYGTVSQKQLIIVKIGKNFQPALASILLEATQDENNLVRVQAAAAIADIENDFYNDYKKKKDDLEKSESLEKLTEFASFIEVYASSSLLDADRTQQLYEEVISLYLRAVKKSPVDVDLKMSLANAYVMSHHPAEALGILEKVNEGLPVPYPDFIFLYLKTLFTLKKFDDIRSYVNKYYLSFKQEFPRATQEVQMMELWYEGASDLPQWEV
jgi:tetratricopeptide (TPR) repeat protein